jgi:hypothetical protein
VATATYEQSGLTYDDLTIVYDGMPESRGLSLLIGERDFTDVMDASKAVVTDTGTGARSLATLSLRTTMAAAPEVKDQSLVALVAHGAGPDYFRGFVRSRHPTTGMNPMLDLIADDIGGLLDDAWIASEVRPAETLPVRIAALWAGYASSFLSSDLSNVAAIGGTLPAQDFVGVTLRQAIEAAISQASSTAYYFVDTEGALHVSTSMTSTAPYAVKVGTPAGGEMAPEHLDIDYDSNSYANRVYIRGATPEGSGYFENAAAITAAGGLRRTRHMDAPDCETSAMATALANMYLGRVSTALARGVFTASSPYDGWRADQNVTITEPDIGISAQVFRIAAVTTTFEKTQSSYRRQYQVEFGAGRSGASAPGSESVGQLVYGQLGGNSRVWVTEDGISVSDTSRVRAHIGRLADGSYGITITDSSGNVLIDGQKIQLSQSEGTLPSGVNVGISQTTVTANGLEVKVSGVSRVIAGQISTGVYGLKVVSTDGVTTVIDGTSNVFKIQASGSLSLTLPARTTNAVVTATSDATLTGLGTLSTIPAHLSFVGPSISTTDKRWIGGNNVYEINAMYGATASGGATTLNFLGLYAQGMMTTFLNGSSQAVVRLGGENVDALSSYTRQGIYHVLKEAAL